MSVYFTVKTRFHQLTFEVREYDVRTSDLVLEVGELQRGTGLRHFYYSVLFGVVVALADVNFELVYMYFALTTRADALVHVFYMLVGVDETI